MRAEHLCSPSPLCHHWHLQAKTNAILWSISNTSSSGGAARGALVELEGTVGGWNVPSWGCSGLRLCFSVLVL